MHGSWGAAGHVDSPMPEDCVSGSGHRRASAPGWLQRRHSWCSMQALWHKGKPLFSVMLLCCHLRSKPLCALQEPGSSVRTA